MTSFVEGIKKPPPDSQTKLPDDGFYRRTG